MMRLVAFLLFVCTFFSAQGQSTLYQQYIERYKGMAIEQMQRYGIPASITLAQGLLESGAGTSMLATKANNHFGIKTGGTWNGPYVTKDDDKKGEFFRKYDSVEQSYEDHSRFLSTRGRYSDLFKLARTDYKGWAHGLKKAGYATNPEYALKLISIIELYELHQYDTQRYVADNTKQPGKEKKHHGQKSEQAGTAGAGLRVDKVNGRYYVIARSGDTFATIAKEMKADERKLRKYNEVDDDAKLNAGDIVFLQKKQSHVARSLRGKTHQLLPGESVYTVSQRYGVKVKTLIKANRISGKYIPRAGDRILLQ